MNNMMLGVLALFLLVRLFASLPRYLTSRDFTPAPHLYFLGFVVSAYLAFTVPSRPAFAVSSTAFEQVQE